MLSCDIGVIFLEMEEVVKAEVFYQHLFVCTDMIQVKV